MEKQRAKALVEELDTGLLVSKIFDFLTSDKNDLHDDFEVQVSDFEKDDDIYVKVKTGEVKHKFGIFSKHCVYAQIIAEGKVEQLKQDSDEIGIHFDFILHYRFSHGEFAQQRVFMAWYTESDGWGFDGI